ncbi:MAG: hypothetical protein LBO70_02085 [Clostridiales Family XIII bacterium]|jgi:hypothetical protein|nr:hypothetical protein [Clostridiales Family XIII bacterium]
MNIAIKGTLKYAAFVGVAVALATLPLGVHGHWLPFAAGLACGIGASMAGFAVMYRFIEAAGAAGGRSFAFTGIGLKFFIYIGAMFTMTALFGLWPGIGTAAGCLTMPVAIIIRNAALPHLRAMRGQAPEDADREYIYETHTRGADGALRYVFIRGSYMETASKGRVYMTHRRFRKLVAIRRASEGEAGRA